MPTDGSKLRDDLVNDKVSDEGIANLDEAKEGKPTEVATGHGVDEVDDATDAAPKAKPLPKTKAGLIKAAYDKLHAMNKNDVAKTVEKMMHEAKTEEEDHDDDEDHEDGDSEMSKTSEKYKKERKHKKETKHHKKSTKRISRLLWIPRQLFLKASRKRPRPFLKQL